MKSSYNVAKFESFVVVLFVNERLKLSPGRLELWRDFARFVPWNTSAGNSEDTMGNSAYEIKIEAKSILPATRKTP